MLVKVFISESIHLEGVHIKISLVVEILDSEGIHFEGLFREGYILTAITMYSIQKVGMASQKPLL